MHVLLTVALSVLIGLPLAVWATGRGALAVLLAPLGTSLLTCLAVVLMLLLGGSLSVWTPVVFVAQFALFLLPRRDPVAGAGGRATLAVGAPFLLPFSFVLAQPVTWDANSIWWLHGAYFTHGAQFARYAIASPAYVEFAHTDYPPASSAPVALMWTVAGGHSLWVAQTASAVLGLSGVVALGYAVRRVTARAGAWLSWLASTGTGLAVWACGDGPVTNGTDDALWAATFTAGTVLLLLDPSTPRPLALGLLTVAGLSKNEGFVMVVAVAVVYAVRQRRQRWIALVPVLAGAAWMALARSLGARSDLVAGNHLPDLLGGRLDAGDRLWQIQRAVPGTYLVVFGAALVTAVLGAAFLRQRRAALGIGSDGWLWAVNLTYLAVVEGIYLTTPRDLAWQLATSLNRVLLANVVLAAASAAGWLVVAAWRPPGAPAPQAVDEALRTKIPAHRVISYP